MKTLLLSIGILVVGLTLFVVDINAQTPLVASATEQARIKPLVAAETKAREELNAKIASLPEAKAVREAKEAYDKALNALNAAADKLPESTAWKEASARALDEAYRLMAEHKLSSREYKPELDQKGDLVFVKNAPKP